MMVSIELDLSKNKCSDVVKRDLKIVKIEVLTLTAAYVRHIGKLKHVEKGKVIRSWQTSQSFLATTSSHIKQTAVDIPIFRYIELSVTS
jgi:hypothetical protein